jgi:hypothetical protein
MGSIKGEKPRNSLIIMDRYPIKLDDIQLYWKLEKDVFSMI